MPKNKRYDSVDEFVKAFPEQLADFDRQAQQAAFDTYNGAIHQGAGTDRAIEMAVGSAKAFSGGQETGRSPSMRRGPGAPAGRGANQRRVT